MKMRGGWVSGPAVGPLDWRGAVLVSAVVIATLAVHAVNTRALDAVRRSDLAVTTLERASRAIQAAPYAVLSILEFDDDTEAGREAQVLFLDAVREAESALDEAGRLAPDEAARIAEFKTRFERVADAAEAPLAIGNATPGLTRGPELTMADLTALASGARLAAQADSQLTALGQDIRTFEDSLGAENLHAVATLKLQSDVAIGFAFTAFLASLIYFWASGRRDLLSRLRLRREARRELLSLEALYDDRAALSSTTANEWPGSRSRIGQETGEDRSPAIAAPVI